MVRAMLSGRLQWARVVAAVLVLSVPCSALAAEGEADLIQQGIALRKAGKDREARELFRRAYDSGHSPKSAAQLGLAEQALGRWEDAEGHVAEALRAPHDPWIAKYRSQLESSLALIRENVARLEIAGQPAGAEVSVNGRSVGRLPLPDAVSVSAGDVVVELRAPGYRKEVRNISIAGARYQRLYFVLVREGAPARPGGDLAVAGAGTLDGTDQGADVGGGEPPDSGDATADDGKPKSTDAEPPSARRVAKWTVASVGVAALAVGITASVLHYTNAKSFDAANGGNCYDQNGRAVDAMKVEVPDCQPYLNAYRTARKWEIAGYATAGAMAIAFAILHFTEPATADDGKVASLSCAPWPGLVGGSCRLEF
jgi:tetratricopeptide (TPR) repeat protein